MSAYRGIETYCDSGTVFEHKYAEKQGYERCIRKDGLFKILRMTDAKRGIGEVEWSDGSSMYLFRGYLRNGNVKTIEFSESKISRHQETEDKYFLHLVVKFFGVPSESHDHIIGYLSKFDINQDLSNGETIALEYKKKAIYGPAIETHRLWISITESVIVGFERLSNDTKIRQVKVSGYRINPDISLADLSFAVPAENSVSSNRRLYSRPDVQGLVALIFIFLTGLFFWFDGFCKSERSGDGSIPWPSKLKMWKLFFKLVAISPIALAGVFILLAIFGFPLSPLSIVALGVLLIFSILAFGCFLLSAHVAYWLASLRAPKASR